LQELEEKTSPPSKNVSVAQIKNRGIIKIKNPEKNEPNKY